MSTQFNWHTIGPEEALSTLKTEVEGLSSKNAKSLLEKVGPNELPKRGLPGWPIVLFRQFISPLILILAAAALISGLLHEWVDFWVIVAAILLNTIVGFVQEFKATKALAQLRSLVEQHAVVRREGREMDVPASEVVPGDILVLNSGDRVVADARLVEVVDLVANEASLTGESMPVDKSIKIVPADTPLAERSNMVFAGTIIGAGRGRAVVVATGIRTEIGQIAELVLETKEGDTPLQAELGRLAKWIAITVVILISIIFVLGLATGRGLFEMFETSVALAVAAIPEGLIVSVTIILAISMQRILKKKALVRRLVAAETLGSVSIICTDKTGTITEGEMKVSQLVPPRGLVSVSDLDKKSTASDLLEILRLSMVCNNASVNEGDKLEKTEVRGSPTERALMEAGLQMGISYNQLKKRYKRYDEIPFDSANKYMVTLNDWEDNGRAMLMKGAPEKVISYVSLVAEKGKQKRLTIKTRESLELLATEMTDKGLRVLALAYKPVKKKQDTITNKDLKGFTFLGFVGLQDPLRPEAKEQIKAAASAGVRTVIITGDHPLTAKTIGEQVGLLTGKNKVVTGKELDDWDDDQLREHVVDIDIYARVEPRHKIRIVTAWQARGEVVSMTGDGVNDAPALKAADIGIALGSGTEVAKEASDIVLLDNNLSTITAAIEQGRVIFDNIRKVIVYLLAGSFTEIVLIGGALLFRLPLPLLATQILWVNLVEDTLPGIALTMEPGEPDVMKRPPRKRNEPLLNKEMMVLIFIIGIVTDLILFGLFVWFLRTTGDEGLARSVMFAAIGMDSLLYIYAVRSLRHSIFSSNPFSNKWLNGAVLIGFALMFLSLLHPFFQAVFEVTPLRLSDWGLLLILSVIKLVAIEITKEIFILRDHRSS